MDPMRAPDFWQTGLGPWPHILAPLGCLYGAIGLAERFITRTQASGVPVICIGNLTAGGTGKTPVALNICNRLQSLGIDAHFLSRGYGGHLPGPVRIDPEHHTVEDVGDEPLLLAHSNPAWVARNRIQGARAARAAGANALILDDGFQDPHIAKDLSLIVIDGASGFGNGRLIPAGPLRETVTHGLGRADGVIIMGEDRLGMAGKLKNAFQGLPIMNAHLRPVLTPSPYKGKKIMGFAGIGRPEKFRETLLAIGAELESFYGFPDHHPYVDREIAILLEKAKELDAIAITTAKDHVRITDADQREQIDVLDVEVAFENEAVLNALLAPILASLAAPEMPDQDGSDRD
jgi:tetraacyldisaccharide 4'-kinase